MGSIAVGDRIAVLPSGLQTRIREIRTFDGARPHAVLHDAVTIELDDEIDVSRGDMLVAADRAPEAARSVKATLCWLSERPLDQRRTYFLRHTTREVRARIDRLDHAWNVSTQAREPAPQTFAMNDIGDVAMTLAQPIVADRYSDNASTGSFILVDEATNATVAAGLIR